MGTFCHLAGVEQKDEVAIANGLPDVDSINQWPVLSGQTAEAQRTDVQISAVTLIDHAGKWKLLTGSDPGSINEHTVPGFVPFDRYAVGYWTGYPFASKVPGAGVSSFDSACPEIKDKLTAPFNNTIKCSKGMDCTKGCLFNLEDDPNEENDVAAQNPQILASMMAKLMKHSKLWTADEPWGVFNPIRNG